MRPPPSPSGSRGRGGSPSGPRPPRRRSSPSWRPCGRGCPPCRSTRGPASGNSRTSSPTARPRWCWPGRTTYCRRRWAAWSGSMWRRPRPPRRRRPPCRSPPRTPRPGRLHLRHDGPAQGGRPAAPGDRRVAGRTGGRLGVDRRGRPRPRPAAVPCARAGAGRPRPAAPGRLAAPPRPVLGGGRGPGAALRGDDAVRRAHDVPPAGRMRWTARRTPGTSRRPWRVPGCWSPARRRCRSTTTNGSPRRPGAGSSSGTG